MRLYTICAHKFYHPSHQNFLDPPLIKPCNNYDLNFLFDAFSDCTDERTFILHANICSLHKNFDILIDFCESLSAKPDIICLTETKLNDISNAIINIPNHNFYHSASPTNAGGIAMYIVHVFAICCTKLIYTTFEN